MQKLTISKSRTTTIAFLCVLKTLLQVLVHPAIVVITFALLEHRSTSQLFPFISSRLAQLAHLYMYKFYAVLLTALYSITIILSFNISQFIMHCGLRVKWIKFDSKQGIVR